MPPQQNDPLTVGDEASRIAAMTDLMKSVFPQVYAGAHVTIEGLPGNGARVRLHEDDSSIRPGGTVSGPAMFKLADFGVYVAVLGHLGQGALEAVTTSMTMNFLRRPDAGDLIGDVKLLKVGRRLAVAEVRIWRDDPSEPVAHATATYAIPSAQKPPKSDAVK